MIIDMMRGVYSIKCGSNSISAKKRSWVARRVGLADLPTGEDAMRE